MSDVKRKVFHYMIQHETIDEILDAGLLELTIENITKCPEFCDNGLFRLCVFGQAEKIIPSVHDPVGHT